MPKTNGRFESGQPYRSKNSSHPLARWRLENGLTAQAFLARVKKSMPRGAHIITRSTLSRYEAGLITRADPEFADAVAEVTSGAVTYSNLCRPRARRASARAR